MCIVLCLKELASKLMATMLEQSSFLRPTVVSLADGAFGQTSGPHLASHPLHPA